jgi:hypothetical protein
MTPQELGRMRDATILALVQRFGCLTTGQVCRAVFSGRYAMQSCQRRLRILTRAGRLHKVCRPGQQNLYAVERVAQVEHRPAVAEVYLRMLRERRAGERITFEPEYALAGGDRADALLTWEMADRTCWAFVEVQRSGKAQLGKYARHYRSGLWTGPVYPRVVVVGQAGKTPSGLTMVEMEDSVRRAVSG